MTGLKQLYAVEPGMTEHDDSPDADEQAIKKLELYTESPVQPGEKAHKPYKVGRMKMRFKW